jgi:hypothetical protein
MSIKPLQELQFTNMTHSKLQPCTRARNSFRLIHSHQVQDIYKNMHQILDAAANAEVAAMRNCYDNLPCY